MMRTGARGGCPAAAALTPAPVRATEPLAECGREQVAMVMDASCALLRGFEAVRAIQQQAAQQAAGRHAQAAGRLRSATGAAELMAIPFELWQADLQGAARSWQELADAALETQAEVMECAWHLFDAESALQDMSAMEALESIPGMRDLLPAALKLWQPPRD